MIGALADVSVPVWMFAGQWVLLFALGGLVVVLYRQLGFVLRLKDIGSERDGLPIGAQAPAFDYGLVGQADANPRRFDPMGQWTLLAFADPGCESCREAVSALERLAPTLQPVSRIMVATASPLELIVAIDAFHTSSVDICHVDVDVPTKLYHTFTTPFAYLIDPGGTVQAKGIAGNDGMIRKMVRKADHRALEIVSAR